MFWERRASAWQRHLTAIDTHLATYGDVAIHLLGVADGERIIDAGCGPATTTRALADRVGSEGEVLGVDASTAMLTLGRRTCENLANVRLAQADIQVDDLEAGFDAAYSRFAIMLLPDPTAGLANIGRAVRPAGRLAFTTWGPLRDNPWMYEPVLAAAPLLGLSDRLPESEPNRLSDADSIRSALTPAGWVLDTVQAIGGTRTVESVEDLTGLVEEGGPLAEGWASTRDPLTRQACIDAVTEAIATYRTGDGWALPGLALCALAHKP